MADASVNEALLAEAVEGVVTQVLRQYRIAEADARRLVSEVMAADRDLLRATTQAADADRLRRMAAFKTAAAAAKKHVYYSLRRYHTREPDAPPTFPHAPEELRVKVREAAAQHRSSAERLPLLEAFHERLFDLIGEPRTLLDVGCGVQPLLFPFDERGRCVERYVAVDRDSAALDLVSAYAEARGDGRLVGVREDLASGWDGVVKASGLAFFDVALLLKVVPVVQRQQSELLDVLAQTPATRWLVTGSRVALAKQRDIERRERATLRQFIEHAGRRAVAEFDVGEEIGWLVE